MQRYRHYLLTVLLVVVAFSNVDTLALGLVLQNIKIDLGLADTQLGFLTGIAYALFYSIIGIPIARGADRGNRVKILSMAAATWSIMVALCGLAANFGQLLLIRIGVAVGESGCVPTANSLIADHFSRAERPRAVALTMLGGPLSVLIGYFAAGWLNQFYGWRIMFVVLGLAGLAPATLAWLTLREPRSNRVAAASSPPSSTRDVCVTLFANTTFRHLISYYSVMAFFSAGILQWLPAFFIRSYSLNTGELGTWLAVVYGLGGTVGTYWGGALASRRAGNNEPLQLKATALLISALAVLYPLIYLSHDRFVAFGLLGLGSIGVGMTTGPVFATIQSLVPEHMRAVSVAIIFMFSNLIGAGLGPLAAGMLSDVLRPLVGEESLRYALLALCPGYFWCGWHLWQASKTVLRDLELVHAGK